MHSEFGTVTIDLKAGDGVIKLFTEFEPDPRDWSWALEQLKGLTNGEPPCEYAEDGVLIMEFRAC